MSLKAYLLGKVFSVMEGGDAEMTEEYNGTSSEDDEDLGESDDKILGQVLNHYQTKHSIINEGGATGKAEGATTSGKRGDDAEFFNYQEGGEKEDAEGEDAEENIGESAVAVDSKLLLADPSGEG